VEVKKVIMPAIEKEFKDEIKIEYRDISEMENYKLLLSLQEKYKAKIRNVWPVFYFEGNFLNGEGNVENNLKQLLAGSVHAVGDQGLPKIDLIAFFKTFTPLAVIGAGLIDGINPCAFTVIVFFISYLALQMYKKKELIVIGLSFIFTVFLTYILMGLGLLEFLYRLEGFWLVSKIVNLGIGFLSIVLGFFALYDFFKFKKTKSPEGLILQLPKTIKDRIHAIIGLHYRQDKRENVRVKKNFWRLILSALITGFLVSILEAVCTGQTYAPTISLILKTSHLKLQALSYLLLYNIMFIVPLFLVFLFALRGVTSEQFSQVLKRNMLMVKILMVILFFGLGIFLLWKELGIFLMRRLQ
jgi:cytochrome c biogenesis protein CcdA